MSKSVILGFTFLVSGRALSFMTRGLQLIPNSAALTPRGIVTLIEFFRFFSTVPPGAAGALGYLEKLNT